MKITQISVFLENKKGRLYEVSELLGNIDINIRALTIAEEQNFGVLRVIVDKPQEALAALKQKGFVASMTDIVAVEVDDKPGGLANILKVLSENALNVEYMYGFVGKFSERALLVFRFDNTDKAIEFLKNNSIKVVGTQDLEIL